MSSHYCADMATPVRLDVTDVTPATRDMAMRIGLAWREIRRGAATGPLREFLYSTDAIDVALDCIIVIDVAGRVIEFNAAAECTFGYTRAQALGLDDLVGRGLVDNLLIGAAHLDDEFS